MLDSETISHLQERLQVYRRNLRHLLDQVAQHGGEAAAPLPLVNGIHEARENIRQIKAELRARNISVEDHPDDARPAPRFSPATEEPTLGNESEPLRAAGDGIEGASQPPSEAKVSHGAGQVTPVGTFPRNTSFINWSAITGQVRGLLLFALNITIASCLGISLLGVFASISAVSRPEGSGLNSQSIPAYLIPWSFFFSVLVVVPVFFLWILISVHSRRLRKQQQYLQNKVERLYEMPEILEYMAEYDRRLFSTVWENWLDFLRYLKKRSQRAEDILKHCVPLEIQGEKLVVGCSSTVIRRQVNGIADNSPKATIEKALYDFYGKPSKITSILRDDTEIVQIKAKLYEPKPSHHDTSTDEIH